MYSLTRKVAEVGTSFERINFFVQSKDYFNFNDTVMVYLTSRFSLNEFLLAGDYYCNYGTAHAATYNVVGGQLLHLASITLGKARRYGLSAPKN
jgi:hypothetical protein